MTDNQTEQLPDYLVQAGDNLARARAIVQEHKDIFSSVSDGVNSATQALREAQTRVLDTPEDAVAIETLNAARTSYKEALAIRDDAELLLLSASDLHDEKFRKHAAAVARHGAEKVSKLSEEFKESAWQVDRSIKELTQSLVEGDRLNRLIGNILKADLNSSVVVKWRTVVLDSLDHALRQARLNEVSLTAGAGYEADHFCCFVGDIVAPHLASSAGE